MITWPFKIRTPLLESLEWATDVIPTKSAEQRFSLRTAPRRTFNFSHILNNYEYTAARALITQQQSYLIPDWPLALNVGSISPSSDPQILFTDDDLNLSAGDSVLLWDDNFNYETATVITIDSNGVELDAIDNYYNAARLVPLLAAEAPEGLQATRPAGDAITAQFQPIVIDDTDIGQSAYATYRGHDLIEDCPIVGADNFEEPVSWETDVIDNITGTPAYLVSNNVLKTQFMMRWQVFTRAELSTLRKFLYSRRGRWKSFWMSSFGRDFELAEDIGVSDVTVRVYAPNGVLDLGVDTFDIEIKLKYVNAVLTYQRQVTSYATGADLNGRPTIVFTIDSSLASAAATVDKTYRISVLRHLRFDADRIDIEHGGENGTRVSVPCKEVPL